MVLRKKACFSWFSWFSWFFWSLPGSSRPVCQARVWKPWSMHHQPEPVCGAFFLQEIRVGNSPCSMSYSLSDLERTDFSIHVFVRSREGRTLFPFHGRKFKRIILYSLTCVESRETSSLHIFLYKIEGRLSSPVTFVENRREQLSTHFPVGKQNLVFVGCTRRTFFSSLCRKQKKTAFYSLLFTERREEELLPHLCVAGCSKALYSLYVSSDGKARESSLHIVV